MRAEMLPCLADHVIGSGSLVLFTSPISANRPTQNTSRGNSGRSKSARRDAFSTICSAEVSRPADAKAAIDRWKAPENASRPCHLASEAVGRKPSLAR